MSTALAASADRFALRSMACAQGELAWREAGAGSAIVLLHGIGSGSASWAGQLDALADQHRVIAWDAPGYGTSAPLPQTKPLARDYAMVLDEWLDRLQIEELVLVGHSLGAIVASAWAAQSRRGLRALVLASPARGYSSAALAVRETKYRERIELIERLGVEGMAAQRSAHLCAPAASAEVIEQVRSNMARITAGGYAQAAHMLAYDDLSHHLRSVTAPVSVLCGELDRVTPPAACQEIAHSVGAPFVSLHGVAHACYVEDPAQFNRALLSCLTAQPKAHHV